MIEFKNREVLGRRLPNIKEEFQPDRRTKTSAVDTAEDEDYISLILEAGSFCILTLSPLSSLSIYRCNLVDICVYLRHY